MRTQGDTDTGYNSVDASRGPIQINIQTWPHLPTDGLGTFASPLEVDISATERKGMRKIHSLTWFNLKFMRKIKIPYMIEFS